MHIPDIIRTCVPKFEDKISKYIYYTNIPESIVKDFKHKSLVLIKGK